MSRSTVQEPGQRPGHPRMLRSLKDLESYKIAATDGPIGKIHDFLFDDEFWIVRYVVVDTGHWLPGRKVLLLPSSLVHSDVEERTFDVDLSCAQVKDSPDIDTDKPVNRQREIQLHEYYGWTYYWTSGGLWPGILPSPSAASRPDASRNQDGDPHLRSVRDVTGYDIEATDGGFGCVDDFIADDETWTIRYVVVATRKWLPSRRVLLSPEWLVGPISWSAQTVKVQLSQERIQQSPEFDPSAPVNRDYEARLYDYYGRPHYW